MAPEQALRAPVDARADLFSVGVMLWQLLTGERLWKDLSDFEIYARLSAKEISPASSIKPDVDPVLDSICTKSLAPVPGDRYSTAADMQAALETWLEAAPERAGSKRLAKIMTDTFAERREVIRKEVELQLERAEHAPQDALRGVPLLVDNQADRATETNSAVSQAERAGTRSPRAWESTARLALEGNRQEGEPTRSAAVVAESLTRRVSHRWWVFAALLGVADSAGAGKLVFRSVDSSRSVVAPKGTEAAAGGGCTSNKDCVGAGPAKICVRTSHKCVELESPLCSFEAPPDAVVNDRTLWIGAMIPLSGEMANAGKPAANIFRLAGTPRSLRTCCRPVGVVLCDDGQDERAARNT